MVTLLEALLELLRNYRREYVNEAHVPYLDTRFRIFVSYLCSPQDLNNFVRLFPQDFEASHSKIAATLCSSTEIIKTLLIPGTDCACSRGVVVVDVLVSWKR